MVLLGLNPGVCLFLEASHIPWFMATSIFKDTGLSQRCHLLILFISLFLYVKELHEDTEPTDTTHLNSLRSADQQP